MFDVQTLNAMPVYLRCIEFAEVHELQIVCAILLSCGYFPDDVQHIGITWEDEREELAPTRDTSDRPTYWWSGYASS